MTAQEKVHQPPPRKYIYRCSQCGELEEREELVVKKAVFRGMGEDGKTMRSRTVAWLCPLCREADPDWNAPKFTSSPGFADATEQP
jgi:hypothetical protein